MRAVVRTHGAPRTAEVTLLPFGESASENATCALTFSGNGRWVGFATARRNAVPGAGAWVWL